MQPGPTSSVLLCVVASCAPQSLCPRTDTPSARALLPALCPVPGCRQEKALLDEIKDLQKKKEQQQIRLEQAENRMDLAMVADIKYGE